MLEALVLALATPATVQTPRAAEVAWSMVDLSMQACVFGGNVFAITPDRLVAAGFKETSKQHWARPGVADRISARLTDIRGPRGEEGIGCEIASALVTAEALRVAMTRKMGKPNVAPWNKTVRTGVWSLNANDVRYGVIAGPSSDESAGMSITVVLWQKTGN